MYNQIKKSSGERIFTQINEIDENEFWGLFLCILSLHGATSFKGYLCFWNRMYLGLEFPANSLNATIKNKLTQPAFF